LDVVYLGNGEFSRDLLQRLLIAGFDIACVLTRPDQPAGRGLRLRPPPVKTIAQDMGVEIRQPPGPKDPAFMSALEELRPQLLLVADYGDILTRSVLDYPPSGCVNVHPSLLPRYRGAAPIRRALMDGVPVSGVTLMLLDEGMDTGPIIAQEELEIDNDDNALLLREKLASLGADMVREYVPLYISGELSARAQDEGAATYADPIAKSEMIIDWNRPAREIANQIRALSPRPGAHTFLRNKRIKILRGQARDDIRSEGIGWLKVQDNDVLLVGTDEGALRVDELQPEGKKSMSAAEFLRGYRLRQGDLFEAPSS
jgi:methionyl-tRNA formyltransferase